MANRILSLLVLVFIVSGCANWTHYTKSKPLVREGNTASALVMDAKQRVIISANQTEDADSISSATSVSNSKGSAYSNTASSTQTIPSSILRVCAEPSPDALSALSASQSGSFGDGKVNIAAALALAESAGSIGLRTQTIQLMRDAMYRLCEGYLSGSLSNTAFETLHRRFQTSMVAILAIEQLTGVVRGPSVALGGNSLSGAAELAAKYTDLSISAQSTLEESQATEAAAKASYDDAIESAKKPENTFTDEEKNELERLVALGSSIPESDKPKKTQLESKKKNSEEVAKTISSTKESLDKATSVRKKREDQFKAYEAARIAAIGGGGNAGATATVTVPDIKPSPEALAAVTSSVETIALSAINKSFSNELCVTILLDAQKNNHAGKLVEQCGNFLAASVKSIENQNNLYDRLIQCYQDKSKNSADCEQLKSAAEGAKPTGLFSTTEINSNIRDLLKNVLKGASKQ